MTDKMVVIFIIVSFLGVLGAVIWEINYRLGKIMKHLGMKDDGK